ncbi:carbohydrate ABC transporter permease [Gracilibacillus phocaeensis]|uniref:carbohydrate ABC transporter permease n=1 Tax=Gracilibacillus phocaeensis TaxID=2042304 RepID=UPI00102F904F|nr:carbohydrate ABC transporter permease [Gracilibacillus phocaeensis]
MSRRKLTSYTITFFLFIAFAISFFPIYMAITNSFKTIGEIFNSVLSFPTELNIDNYIQAYNRINWPRSTLNTFIVSMIGVIGIIFAGSLAGYKLSRYRGKLSNIIYFLFIASMLVPFHAIMIPLNKVALNLSVQGSIWGLGLIYIGLGVNLAIFLCHGFVKSIPREIEEAANIDGCGEFQTFFRIVFPLLLPIIFTIGIIQFLWIWNDFLLALIMLPDQSNYTIVLATNVLFGEFVNEWDIILAALILAVIPVVILFIFFQKSIIEGLVKGAVKG